VLVNATGAEYMRVIPGSEQRFVMTANEALCTPEKIGKRVVIIGGGVSGCEVAEFLSNGYVSVNFVGTASVSGVEIQYSSRKNFARKQRGISILEMRDTLCADMYEDNARIMRIKLSENEVKHYLGVHVDNIGNGIVTFTSIDTGKQGSLPFDTVILSAGLIPKSIDVPDNVIVYQIGDALKPGKIIDAIYIGEMIGRLIE
jgi:pyruvate/2-oxoglutarate dehydrogenase complex dihydrolipoamide dehydrogenase (E3) component